MNGAEGDRRRAVSLVRHPILLGLSGILIVAIGGLLAWTWLAPRGRQMPEGSRASGMNHGVLEQLNAYGRVPDFSLTERSGRPITPSDLLGKVWVVDFFYTRCTDTCPLQSAHMARLQADLLGQGDVRLVSISIDPEYDTPERLSTYATRFRADPQRWLFLTGSKDAIYRLAVDGFHLGVADTGPKAQLERKDGWAEGGPARTGAHPLPKGRVRLLHSSRFVLVDRQARIRGYYEGTDWEAVTRLRDNLKLVLRPE